MDRGPRARPCLGGGQPLRAEVAGVQEWYAKFGAHLPKPLDAEREKLAQRVAAQPETWSAK